MTPSLLSPPESGVNGHGALPWLDEVLACPACQQHRPELAEEAVHCRHIQNHFSLRNGIVYGADQEKFPYLEEQREVWQSLDKARGTYDLPLQNVLRMPEDKDARALLDWLRNLLRGRSPLRILQLNARQGWAARALAEDGHQVVAADVLDDEHIGLGCAVRLRDQTGQRFACVRISPTGLSFRPEAFDCVCCFDTLRHIPDLERFFQEIGRVLRPGGLFLALQEPFRGALTTQTQRLFDTAYYRLARWWLPGKLSGLADPAITHLRSRLGATLHDARRRVPYCLALGEAARLQTIILPAAVALTFSPDLRLASSAEAKRPVWLDSLARDYRLDIDRLQVQIERASQSSGQDLIPELLSHWMLVGNIDGVLLARKGGPALEPFPAKLPMDPERARRLDPLLLGCTPDGFVPIYGVHSVHIEEQERYSWIQPQAGLLVPACTSLEMTLACPPKPFCSAAVRVEIRLETEPLPVAIFLISPGKRTTLRLPIPVSVAKHGSLFVNITTNFGFMPSDFNPAPGSDTRLLAVQLMPYGR
jgi:SAM-dependent methyltransferase